MILHTAQHDIESNVMNKKSLTISNNPIIIELLTSKLYADPLKSVLREYASNAIDACVISNKPIDYTVNFPTPDYEILSFRDYGIGMDSQTLTGLFLMIGESSKRNTNTQIGAFGIGRLSALALSESFYVTSFKHGKLTKIYMSFKDSFILEESNTSERDGTLIEIPLDYTQSNKRVMEDYYEFYAYPPSNYKSPTQLQLIHKGEHHLYLGANGHSFIIRVGGIPYTSHQVSKREYITVNSLLIDVPIGSVTFSSSREQITSNVYPLIQLAIPYIEQHLLSITTTVNFEELEKFIHSIRTMLPATNNKQILHTHVYKGDYQDRFIKLLDSSEPLSEITSNDNWELTLENIPPIYSLVYPKSAQDMHQFKTAVKYNAHYKVMLTTGITQTNLKKTLKMYNTIVLRTAEIILDTNHPDYLEHSEILNNPVNPTIQRKKSENNETLRHILLNKPDHYRFLHISATAYDHSKIYDIPALISCFNSIMNGTLYVESVSKQAYKLLKSKQITIEDMEYTLLNKVWYKDYTNVRLRHKINPITEPWQNDVNLALDAKRNLALLHSIQNKLLQVSNKLNQIVLKPIPLFEEFPLLQFISWEEASSQEVLTHVSAYIHSNTTTHISTIIN